MSYPARLVASSADMYCLLLLLFLPSWMGVRVFREEDDTDIDILSRIHPMCFEENFVNFCRATEMNRGLLAAP